MFLAACSFGAGAVLIKLAYHTGLRPAELLPLQNLVALACLWPMMLISHGFPRLKRGQILRLVLQGLAGNFAISVCYFWAAQRIDVSLLSIILFSYPGLVLSYQIVAERHRAAAWELMALALAFAGVVLAVEPFHGTASGIDRLGLILSVGAAASYAFMNLYGQKLSRDLSALVITTFTSTVSTLALMAVLPPRYWLTFDFSQRQWIFIAGLGLLSTVLPMNLMYLAIRRIGAFHVSVISIAELPCILVLAYFILHERMDPWQMLGGGIILLSMALMQPSREAARRDSTTDAG